MHLRGDLAGELQENEGVVLGVRHLQEEVLVVLLEHQLVFLLPGAEPVAPQLVGAHGGIGSGVEEGAAVVGPGRAVVGVLDGLEMVGAGAHVAEAEGEALGPGGVDRVGQQGVVGADGERAQGEELVTLGLRVLVEQDLLAGRRRVVSHLGGREVAPCGLGRRLGYRESAVDGVLQPLDRARVVPPGALAGGHAEVGLLDAGHDLFEERLLQVVGVGHDRRRVPVLRLEVGDDPGVVAVPQPVPLVDALVPVRFQDGGSGSGAGGRRERGRHVRSFARDSVSASQTGRRWDPSPSTSVR